MGVSTNAYLFFGIDNIYSSENGHRSPILEDKDDTGDLSLEEVIDEILKDHGTSLEQLGLEVDFHGSGEYPIYYVYSKMFVAYRGYPEEVNHAITLSLEPFVRFCGIFRLPVEPKWYLASYWG